MDYAASNPSLNQVAQPAPHVRQILGGMCVILSLFLNIFFSRYPIDHPLKRLDPYLVVPKPTISSMLSASNK